VILFEDASEKNVLLSVWPIILKNVSNLYEVVLYDLK